MSRIAIVADDLTGAADAAAHLAPRAETVLLLDGRADWPDVPVVTVDTDTRDATAQHAAATVRSVVERAAASGALVYKKIDSTLRGNVAVEVVAAAAALGSHGRPALAVVAPAFPALGRTVVDGVVRVDGHALKGPCSGDVATLLGAAGLTTAVAHPDADLPRRLRQAFESGLGAVVVDAAADDDLATVFAAAQRVHPPLLLVGSGGLSRCMAALVTDQTSPDIGPAEPAHTSGPDIAPVGTMLPVLVVSGSWSDTARGQAAVLEAAGAVRVTVGPDASEQLAAALSPGSVALLTADPTVPVDVDRAREYAGRLSRAALSALDLVGWVVATGGDTARALLVAAGIDRLHVGGEVEPGIVWSRAPGRRFVFVTKAGAFGDDHVLVRTVAELTGRHHP